MINSCPNCGRYKSGLHLRDHLGIWLVCHPCQVKWRCIQWKEPVTFGIDDVDLAICYLIEETELSLFTQVDHPRGAVVR